MTSPDNLPEPHEEEWIDAEIVDDDWEAARMAEQIRRARQEVVDAFMADTVRYEEQARMWDEHRRLRRIASARKYTKIWCGMIVVYLIGALAEWRMGSPFWTAMMCLYALFGVFMLMWNRHSIRSLTRGDG